MGNIPSNLEGQTVENYVAQHKSGQPVDFGPFRIVHNESADRIEFIDKDSGSKTYIPAGSTGDVTGTTSASSTGVYVAAPGEVQSKIDTASGDGGGTVVLDPQQSYQQPSTRWLVKSDVTLDFNGAIMYGTGTDNAVDVMHLQPRGRVIDPVIDLYDGGAAYTNANKYSGNIFYLDSDLYGNYFADGTTVRGGWIGAVESDATLLRCQATNNSHVSFLTFDLNLVRPPGSPGGIHTVDTGVHIHSGNTDTNAWINSLQFYGNYRDALTTWKHTGINMNFAHYFWGMIQPPSKFSDPLPDAVWHIDGNNVFFSRFAGVVWDVTTDSFPNRDAWQIDGWAGENSLQLLHPTTGTERDLSNFTVSTTSGDNYVVDPIQFNSTLV